jgi:hypothetical protein
MSATNPCLLEMADPVTEGYRHTGYCGRLDPMRGL